MRFRLAPVCCVQQCLHRFASCVSINHYFVLFCFHSRCILISTIRSHGLLRARSAQCSEDRWRRLIWETYQGIFICLLSI